jgi:hypothetical protein
VVVDVEQRKTKENEREKLFQVKGKRGVLKKSLTESALLEMSGKATYQDVARRLLEGIAIVLGLFV